MTKQPSYEIAEVIIGLLDGCKGFELCHDILLGGFQQLGDTNLGNLFVPDKLAVLFINLHDLLDSGWAVERIVIIQRRHSL